MIMGYDCESLIYITYTNTSNFGNMTCLPNIEQCPEASFLSTKLVSFLTEAAMFEVDGGG